MIHSPRPELAVEKNDHCDPDCCARGARLLPTQLRTIINAGRSGAMTFRQRLRRHPVLIAISVVVGFGVQGADRVLFSNALGRLVVIEEPIIFVLNALFTALPLIALALQARQHVAAWLAGFATSALLSWWWLQKGIAYQRNPNGSGVEMGGAITMLLAPFVITAACLWLNQLLSRQRANDS
jgi:hypothetical protein